MQTKEHKKNSWLDAETLGTVYGFLGVLGFSLTLPATRVAVSELDRIDSRVRARICGFYIGNGTLMGYTPTSTD